MFFVVRDVKTYGGNAPIKQKNYRSFWTGLQDWEFAFGSRHVAEEYATVETARNEGLIRAQNFFQKWKISGSTKFEFYIVEETSPGVYVQTQL